VLQKKCLMFLVFGLVASLPLAVQGAVNWTGSVSNVWDFATAPGNWTGDPLTGGFLTEEVRIDAGSVTTWPEIADGDLVQWGLARIKGNGATLNQTGGIHAWANGTGTTQYGLALFRADVATPATLHMTGGIHAVDRLGLGHGLFSQIPDGFGRVDIWGTSLLAIVKNAFILDQDLFALTINDGSFIDIREFGRLSMPFADAFNPARDVLAELQAFETAGKIIASEVGRSLVYSKETRETAVGSGVFLDEVKKS
jgi:hypothetical protein